MIRHNWELCNEQSSSIFTTLIHMGGHINSFIKRVCISVLELLWVHFLLPGCPKVIGWRVPGFGMSRGLLESFFPLMAKIWIFLCSRFFLPCICIWCFARTFHWPLHWMTLIFHSLWIFWVEPFSHNIENKWYNLTMPAEMDPIIEIFFMSHSLQFLH